MGELVDLGRRIMAVGAEERKAAKLATLRQGDARPVHFCGSERERPGGRTPATWRAYIAARGVGISEATYARANALVSAAEDPEDPAHDTAVASLAEAEAWTPNGHTLCPSGSI